MPGICRKILLSLSFVMLLAASAAAAAPDSLSPAQYFAGRAFWRVTTIGVLFILGGIGAYLKGLFVRTPKTRAELELEAEAKAQRDVDGHGY